MKGVLVANLGTPAAPRRREVAAYLREFLSDPRVVDLPRWLWLPLLYLVIIPLRAGRSAAAYAKVWTPAGSPLLVNSQAIADALEKHLNGHSGAAVAVRLAMRYGQPAVLRAVQELRDAGVDELTVLPLYPQYSGPTTATLYDALDAALVRLDWRPRQLRVQDYHDDPAWVSAVAASVLQFQRAHGRPGRLVFSLHGIPQRYVRQGDPYEAQCRAGVAAIARELRLQESDYLLAFQSRVGREPWLQPYTDVSLGALAQAGVKHVQVVCPGFSADCLETLEEIDMQNRELFLAHGGERYEYIPCLNEAPAHIGALAGILHRLWAH